MNKKRLLLVAVLVVLIAAFFAFGLHRYFSLELFKAQQAAITEFVAQRPVVSGLVFFLIYVAGTGLSLPGAAVLTLIAGAVFGLLVGTVGVSVGPTLCRPLSRPASRVRLRQSL